MSCDDPDDPANWPRNLFVWRSNLLGSSGKGHEYFLKHLLGTSHGVLGKDLGATGGQKPLEVARSEEHTSELQSLMRISYAVFCLKKKKQKLKLHHRNKTTHKDSTRIQIRNYQQ